MKRTTVFLAALLTALLVDAQITFEKTYGGDYGDSGHSVLQTTDGGYILTGGFGLPGDNSDIYLLKTDELGNQEWMQTYEGTSYEYGISLLHTSDNGFFIVGRQGQFPYWDIFLLKTDEDGNSIWSKTYGLGGINDMVIDCKQTNDDGYIITGKKGSFGNEDVLLMKVNIYGDTLWTKTYGGAGDDSGNSIQQTSDNGYIISGWTYSFGAGNCDAYLIKTNENGDTLWTKTYGTAESDYGGPVIQTDDGGYMISGSILNSGSSGMDLYLIRTDLNGDTLWTKTYMNPGWESATSMVKTTDDNYLILCKYNESGGYEDIYMRKIDQNGNTLWTNVYGESGNDGGYCIKNTSDNGFVVTGTLYSYANGSFDIYLLKTDENGLLLGTEQNYDNTFSGKIFPNPNNGKFSIEFDNVASHFSIVEIFNTNSQIIYKRNFDNNTDHTMKIDLSNYPKGVYYLKVLYDKTVVIEKIITH